MTTLWSELLQQLSEFTLATTSANKRWHYTMTFSGYMLTSPWNDNLATKTLLIRHCGWYLFNLYNKTLVYLTDYKNSVLKIQFLVWLKVTIVSSFNYTYFACGILVSLYGRWNTKVSSQNMTNAIFENLDIISLIRYSLWV